MLQCWNNDPDGRPNFVQILDMINILAGKHKQWETVWMAVWFSDTALQEDLVFLV